MKSTASADVDALYAQLRSVSARVRWLKRGSALGLLIIGAIAAYLWATPIGRGGF